VTRKRNMAGGWWKMVGGWWLVVCMVGVTLTARAGDVDTTSERHYVLSARPADDWRLRGSIGLSLAILPQPLTEYPTPAPMLDVRYRFTMPMGITAYGRLGSNVATSIAQLGGMFSMPSGNLSVGAGYSVAFVYGYLVDYVDGFNTTQQRWINYPMLTASFRFPAATLTVRAEAELTTSVVSTIEDQPTGGDRDVLTGGALTVALEQPFFGTTHVILGFTLQNSTQPYQAWFLYNTFKDKLFSSEFFMGIIL
jgi:hypothetical protein